MQDNNQVPVQANSPGSNRAMKRLVAATTALCISGLWVVAARADFIIIVADLSQGPKGSGSGSKGPLMDPGNPGGTSFPGMPGGGMPGGGMPGGGMPGGGGPGGGMMRPGGPGMGGQMGGPGMGGQMGGPGMGGP